MRTKSQRKRRARLPRSKKNPVKKTKCQDWRKMMKQMKPNLRRKKMPLKIKETNLSKRKPKRNQKRMRKPIDANMLLL